MKNTLRILMTLFVGSALILACEDKPASSQEGAPEPETQTTAEGQAGHHDTKPKSQSKKGGDPIAAVEAGAYYCPMGAEYVQDGPGKCPICGMDVVLKEGDRAKTKSQHHNHPANAKDPKSAVAAGKHFCPMGAEWVQDEPGTCPLCGMALKAKEQGAMKPGDSAGKRQLARQGEAKLGDKTMCPIMGGEFEVSEKSPSVKHEGKDIYFCCPGCDTKFKEDPAAKLEDVNKKIDEANSQM